MFVMTDNPEFECEAKGKLPGPDGEPFSFRARFVALSATEQNGFDLASAEATVDFLKRTFVGLSDVVDDDGGAVPFTEEARDWLIDRVHTRSALVKAYFGGVYEAAQGN